VIVNDDEYWMLRENGRQESVPLADLSDESGGRRRGPRSRRIAALLLAAAVVAAGAVGIARMTNDSNTPRRRVEPGTHRSVKINDSQARVDVLAALNSTTASGSFKIHFRLSAEPAPGSSTTSTTCPPFVGTEGNVPNTTSIGAGIVVCGGGYTYSGPDNNRVTISGDGVVHVEPTAMVTTAQVPNLGEITTRVDGTRVWEDGGANYGMTPSSDNGPGSPLSQFASLVSGTLGRREGAIAMNSLASPTGYLDIAKESITASSKLDDAVVNGVPVHVYEVTIDTMKALERPGLTSEEIKATTAALDTLRAEGYTTTTVRLSIDGLGFIRRAHTVVSFDDGGTVTGDTTFSDFGCSSVVMLANGPSIVANPDGCTSATPAPITTAAP
jgi:hypothetical protein